MSAETQKVYNLAEIARLPLVDILQMSLHLEYRFIVNYPRIVDQIVHTERIAGKESEIAKTLEFLGKASIQHADWTAKLIRDFGGEPIFDFEVFDERISTADWCLQILNDERLALSLYEQAKSMAEQRQIKGVWGKLASLLFGQSRSVTANRKTIVLLDKLAYDERRHTELAKKVLSALNIPFED